MNTYQEFLNRSMSEFTETLGVGEVESGWVGGGAGVACWWLDSDRALDVDEVRDVVFAQMLAYFSANEPDMVIPEARVYFCIGFHWLLEFDGPGDGVSVH